MDPSTNFEPSTNFAVPAGAPGVASWAPWPAALHDARHSGAALGTVCDGEGVVVGVASGDLSGTVHVFRVADGYESTTYHWSDAQIWTAIVVDDQYRAYYGTQSGHAIGFDAQGTPLFDVDLGAPIDSYPALTHDRTLIIGDRNGTSTAIGGPDRDVRAADRQEAPGPPAWFSPNIDGIVGVEGQVGETAQNLG